MLKLLVSAALVALAYSCTDGTDNTLPLDNCGSGGLTFTNVKVFTYDKNGAPLCSGSQGLVNFPGQIKIKNVQGSISSPLKFESMSTLLLTLKKNEFPKIAVCEDGKHGFPGVPDTWCNFDLCGLPGLATICQQLDGKTGAFNLPVDSTISLPDLPDFLKPLIKGDFVVAGKLQNSTTSSIVGCLQNLKVPAD